jgi:hypothetical protein
MQEDYEALGLLGYTALVQPISRKFDSNFFAFIRISPINLTDSPCCPFLPNRYISKSRLSRLVLAAGWDS